MYPALPLILRARGADDIAPAPDRFDFGKWQDVSDIYFGRYAALVVDGLRDQYLNEGDWFDYSVGDENASNARDFSILDKTTLLADADQRADIV